MIFTLTYFFSMIKVVNIESSETPKNWEDNSSKQVTKKSFKYLWFLYVVIVKNILLNLFEEFYKN